ncbi:MAG TPA: hypothetical protein VF474_13210 [Phenylobacterium sp.]
MADGDVAQPPGDRAGSGPPAAGFIARLLMFLAQILPFLVGVGFFAPLITQLIERALPEAAHAQWPLLVGLAIGGSWGAVANLRGRWL